MPGPQDPPLGASPRKPEVPPSARAGLTSARLAELGIELPQAATVLGAYVPAVRTGNLVYTSGQLPITAGKLMRMGKVGAEVPPELAKTLARVCALNALAAIDALVGVDAVTRVVKVVGFVASAPGFSPRNPVTLSPIASASFFEVGPRFVPPVAVASYPAPADDGREWK